MACQPLPVVADHYDQRLSFEPPTFQEIDQPPNLPVDVDDFGIIRSVDEFVSEQFGVGEVGGMWIVQMDPAEKRLVSLDPQPSERCIDARLTRSRPRHGLPWRSRP